MLAKHISRPARQRGVILLMTLIALVVMTLAALALTRSADTTSIIAGNLAFQQSATQAADLGVEAAVDWLEARNGPTLYASDTAHGYKASGQDPSSGQSWDAFWTAVLSNQKVTLATDSTTGNTVSYAIQRLCYGANAEGNAPGAAGTGCFLSPGVCSLGASGGSMGGGGAMGCPKTANNQVYYRITVRIDGPRDTMNYVQAIVAM